MEKLSEDRIQELKAVYGEISHAVIRWRDENSKEHRVEFVHKRPSFENYEAFQSDIPKLGLASANRNLIASLCIHPESNDVVGRLDECPIAVDNWLGKVVLPTFGGDVVEAGSTKL